MKSFNKILKYVFYTEKLSPMYYIFTSIVCFLGLAVYVTGLFGNFSFLTLIFITTFWLIVNGLIVGNIYSVFVFFFSILFSYKNILSSIRYDYSQEYLFNIPAILLLFWFFAIHLVYNNQKYKYKKDNYKKELELRIEEGNNNLSVISINSMDTLYQAYTVKNPKEKAHSERVADLSKFIALYLNEDKNFSDLCYKAGLLHDIGKIKFSDEFYNKTEYTDEEYELYKTHVLFGSELFSKFQSEEIALAVKYHHEKLNGTGYPEGLKGDQIPLIAQIVGLADETDSLDQEFSNEEVIQILKSKSDVEYSKKLIDCVMKLI